MLLRTLLLLALTVPVLASGAGQPDGLRQFPDREAFVAASPGLTTIDFEGLARRNGFALFRNPEGLATRSVRIRTSGGGRFGPGVVTVTDGGYVENQPLYRTGTGAALRWSPSNQPGNATLDITPPEGTTAFAVDLWTAQPQVSSIDISVETDDGKSLTLTVHSRPRPHAAFAGFVAEVPLRRVQLRIPKGQTALILDNLTFGKTSEDRVAAAPARPAPVPPAAPSAKPVPEPRRGEPDPQPKPEVRSKADARPESDTQPKPGGVPAGGEIAYIRGGKEIRVIDPDGRNDRRLWTHPAATAALGINGLAWRPDGKELAFTSGHAAATSLYHSDVYTIRPDGTGLRKVTNPPLPEDFKRFPKGTVSVTFRNIQPAFLPAAASAGVFIVYVVGAAEAQSITVPVGAARTVVFPNVADFGTGVQPIVATYGKYRWFMPGTDVQAGKTIKAPDFGISGDGIEYYGAYRPVWRRDGSRISYRQGVGTLESWPLNLPAGSHVFEPLLGFKKDAPLGTTVWDWGPTPELADQLIYTVNDQGDSSIYQGREGSAQLGKKLVTFDEVRYQLAQDLRWLPDGSGFLWSHRADLLEESSNLFRYDFATRRTAQLTRFPDYVRTFSISPDGQWIAFERAKSPDESEKTDVWVVRSDGREPRLLVRDAASPAWRR